ncbi:MAG: glycosyltransferase involved in cell wall biosynthesis [Bacteroidia bacterium]|jgi:undecaprenyl-phosphate 4-deoxy-4-formamido-L-arabinose transferase
MKNERVAIVIPFYDGLDTIQALVSRIADVCLKQSYDYQVILVDDSADEFKSSALHKWFGTDENISLITLPENFGQHYATVEGLKVSVGCSVITLDEDLQHCPEDIPALIEVSLAGKFDVVYGNRKPRDWRYWVGRMILAFCFPNGPHTTCSFRLVQSEMVDKITKLSPKFYELEGMIYQLRPKYGYADVLVNTTGRDSNKSSYSVVKVFSLISNLIAYYSWFPIILVSVACVIVQLLLLLEGALHSLIFLPISGISVLTLMAYISTRLSKTNS